MVTLVVPIYKSLDNRIVTGCGTGVTAGTLSLGARSHFLLCNAKFRVARTYVSANAAFVLKIRNPYRPAEIAHVETLDSAETVDYAFKDAFDDAVTTLTKKSKYVCTFDNTELANRISQVEVNRSLDFYGAECTNLIVAIKPVNTKECGEGKMAEDGFLSMVEAKVREKFSDEIATKIVALVIQFWEIFK